MATRTKTKKRAVKITLKKKVRVKKSLTRKAKRKVLTAVVDHEPLLKFTETPWREYRSCRGYQKRRMSMKVEAIHPIGLHGVTDRQFWVKEEPIKTDTGRVVGHVYYVPGSLYYFGESMDELKKNIERAYVLQLKCSEWQKSLKAA